MTNQIKGIFDLTIPELHFVAEMLGFSSGHYTSISYDKSLKEIASLKLSVLLDSSFLLENPNNLDFRSLLNKLNKLTENDLLTLKNKFDTFSKISVTDWSSGVLRKIPEVDRLAQAGLLI